MDSLPGIEGLFSVDAGDLWTSWESSKLTVEDGVLASTELDSQIHVTFGSPLRHVGVALKLQGPYAGDRFCIYYATPRGYSEATTVILEPQAGENLYLLNFDDPVESLRIDPIEGQGPTNIASFTLAAAKDAATARELLQAHAPGGSLTSLRELSIICDPDKREAMAHFTTKAIKGELRARAKLRRPKIGPRSSVNVVFEPQPNFLDPDDTLLEASARATCRELFGVEPRLFSASLGRAEPADLTLCVAQTAFRATMGTTDWKVPDAIEELRNLCFMSAGSAVLGLPGEYGFKPTKRSQMLLKLFFAGPWLHGVRDAHTAELLDAAGVGNYVVVGTPSLWDVPADLGESIPREKGERVLFAADENYHDPKNDLVALKRLGEAFGEVALWPRDDGGALDYAGKLVEHANIQGKATILEPGAPSLDAYLAREGTDYVGPNLEAGIRALKAHRRTLILTGDDRSKGVVELCSLPAMRRIEVADSLRRWLAESHVVRLTIPQDAIAKWKAQFN